jgi:ABC-type sugar transport system permease subunit
VSVIGECGQGGRVNKLLGNRVAILLFVLPATVIFSVFIVLPLVPSFVISLYEHDGFSFVRFVGLGNYRAILHSATFWQANLRSAVVVVIQQVLGLGISFSLAVLLSSHTRGMQRYFKTASFIPAVLSVTVVGALWVAIYQPDWGLLNGALKAVGLGRLARPWLHEYRSALVSVIVTFVWQYIGFNMVMFYAGMMSIPEKYYESARIEGAGLLRTTFGITIPLLGDVIRFVLVLSVLGSLRLFDHVQIMTRGGPGDASQTPIYYLYYVAFLKSSFGEGSAVAILFAIEGVAVSLLIQRLIARERLEFT